MCIRDRVIDFPPGTGDEPLTVSQTLPNLDGVVIVTTPQEVALMDSRKSINFAKTISVPVLGVVENMSGYKLSGNASPGTEFSLIGPNGVPLNIIASEDGAWSATLDLFKSGGGEESAQDLDVPFLGRLPFDPGVVRGGDDGVHRIVADPSGETAQAFSGVVEKILNSLDNRNSHSVKIT